MKKLALELITAVVTLACLQVFPLIVSAQELVVGVEDLQYKPYYYLENNEYRGAAREILDAFAVKQGLLFVYRPLPVKRLYKEFLSGCIDFKFPANTNWTSESKKNERIAYSQPVLEFIDGMMVKPEHLGQGTGRLRIIGMLLGFTPFGYDKLINSGRIILAENASFRGMLEQVITERTDGAYINPAVARYQLSHVLHKPGALVFDPGLPHLKDSFRFASTKHPDIINLFDKFLIEDAVLLNNIKKKHDLLD